MESSYYLNSTTGIKLFVREWMPENTPHAIVIIQHGLSEHSARYNQFAQFLNTQGIAVYANDIRGHGKTAQNEKQLGFLDSSMGWYKVVEDLNYLHYHALKAYPNLPIFILGHSMGSFIVRHYIQQYNDMPTAGAIIMATTYSPELLRKSGVALSRSLSVLFGKNSKSPLITHLNFGKFNGRFRPNRTSHDWLSRNETSVDDYLNDPLCGAIPTLGLWHDFLDGVGALSKRKATAKTDTDLPLLFLGGTHDSVSEFGKGIKIVVDQYKAVEMKHIEVKMYQGARHELLNETNHQEVYTDILQWLTLKMKVLQAS